jgi:hypothetical protein
MDYIIAVISAMENGVVQEKVKIFIKLVDESKPSFHKPSSVL